MLPKILRFWLFETLSLKTMRYVHAIPRRKAIGLVAQVYDMIEEDFFCTETPCWTTADGSCGAARTGRANSFSGGEMARLSWPTSAPRSFKVSGAH